MTEIRPFQTDDLPAVAALLRANLPGWEGDEQFIATQTLDHPWADPELPSLVALDDKRDVVGFIGAQTRRLRFDDKSLRAVCCTQLTVDGESRATGAGVLLLKQVVAGPQELTWSDASTDTVARLWSALGGRRDHARSCDWMLVLRPLSWVREAARAVVRRRSVGRDLIPVAALPGARRGGPPPPEGVSGEAASTATLVESLPQILGEIRLRIEHDTDHLDHMFAALERHFDEPIVRRLVRQGGRPIGWYAYLRRERGRVAHVRHLAATEAHADAVLGELISHLRDEGTAVLTGRAEPHLAEALSSRFAVLGYARGPVLQAPDPEISAVLASESSLLTRLDGEPFAT